MPLEPPEAAIVIAPDAFVMEIPVPAVNVERVNPVPFPISRAPFAGVVVSPVPPLAIGKVPVTPVESGKPVAFVKVTDVGVPRIGVTNVGLVANTFAPVPVSSVSKAARFALVGVPRNVKAPVAVVVVEGATPANNQSICR